MDVSRVARKVTMGTVVAMVVALAGLGWAPTASAAAGDESGLMKAGSFATFDVLANDVGAGSDWYVEPVDTSDPTVFGSFDATLAVDLSDNASFTGTKAIAYHVFDGNGDPQGTSTLTVQVTPAVLVAEGGNGQVTLSWLGLPGSIDGARISYGTNDVDVFDHTPEPGKTTVTKTGAAPWTITGLTNGTEYTFYVTPRIGSTEMYRGSTATRAPRAGTNAPPVAVDDTVSLVDDQVRFFDPVQNDTDADDDALEMITHSSPAHGVLTCESFGCEYDPTGTRQDDSFTYTVSDGYGGTDTGAVTLVARSATLTNDTAATPATKDKVVNVLANDTGVLASDRVDVTAVSGGADAEVQPDRTVLFRAPSAGPYTFTYAVYTADFETLGTATATITVSAAPPISANPDTDETVMGVPVTIPVWQNDTINPANFPLSNPDTKVLTGPVHGTAVVDFAPERYGTPSRVRNLPQITYTPVRHWKGTDTFTYQVKDNAGNLDSATVTVNVGAPGPDFAFTDDGIGATDLRWFGNDSPDIDKIEVCYATSADLAIRPAYPTRPCATTWPVTGTPDSLHVTGLTNGNVYVGSVYFHYDDGTPGGVWTDPANFDAFPGVQPVDSLWSEAGTTTPASSPGKIRVFWNNPAGSVGTTVAWSTVTNPQSPAAAGVNKIDVAQGATQVDIPSLTEGTTYYISVFARNPGGGYASAEEMEPVLLRATNSAPVAVTDAVNVNKSQSAFPDVLGNDTDPNAGDAQGIRGNTNPSHGTAVCSLYSCRYTPTTGYVGSDSFTYTLSDGHWGTATGTVNLTVGAPRNPVGGTDFYTSTINKVLTFNLNDTASDPDGGPLTYSNFSALSGLSCQATGACTYTGTTLGNDFPFTFTVTDDTSRTGTGTIHLKVVANQPPVVRTQFLSVQTGGTLSINLTATDPDGDTLLYGDISKPQKGTLTCTTPPACSYSQNVAGKSGEDSFFYAVDDQHGGVVYGEVYIDLVKVNHPPVATGFTTPSTDNATPLAIDLSTHATDSDGDALTYAVVTAPTAAQGAVTCSSGGSCAFTPNPSFIGNATFTFRVSDGQGFSNTATVTIPVSQANRAPVAPDKAFTVRQGDPRAVILSTGVSDPDNDTLTYGAPSDPPHGTVTCTTATACSYTSDPAYLGTDTFTYTVNDGHGHTKTVTVTMTVVANQAPVATDDTASVVMNVATAINVAANDAADPDGDTRTFAQASDPAHGTVSCTGSGVCTYTPATDYVGPDAFTYSVDDAHGGSDTGTVSVTVTPAPGTATIVRGGAATRSVNSPLKVTGTLTPARPGATVKLQRLVGATWTDVASALESSTGAYAFSLKQPTGTWKFRVTSPETSGRGATTSPGLTAGFYAVSMPSHKASGDKYVTIKNIGKVAVNLKGWTITTKAKKVLTLPSFSLAVGKSVRIHPGPGRTKGADVYLKKATSVFARHESLTLRDLVKVTVATRKW